MNKEKDYQDALRLIEVAALSTARQHLKLESIELKLATVREEKAMLESHYRDQAVKLQQAKQHLRRAIETAVSIKERINQS